MCFCWSLGPIFAVGIDPPPRFKKVTVEISGREGYNSAAVNGVWYFWKARISHFFGSHLEKNMSDNVGLVHRLMIMLMILIVLIIQYFHKVRTYLISLCYIYMYIFDSCSFLISYRELEQDPSLQHVRGGLLCQTYPLAKSVCSTFC